MRRMKFDAYIFDLDGTLLDTLPDLVALTNMVLEEHDMPLRTREEVLSFVGNGARVLLERATPPGTSACEIDAIMNRWKGLYPEFGHKYTKPYPGMPEVLARMKSEGARLGVLSNKFDAAVKQVIDLHFPGVFDLAWGECPEVPRKPDPTGLNNMMAQLGVMPQRTAYVGDSGTDMKVACAAGATAVGVTWGYQSVSVLKSGGAHVLVDQPQDLAAI